MVGKVVDGKADKKSTRGISFVMLLVVSLFENPICSLRVQNV